MELDESNNPFSCEDIAIFHKTAQENGAIFTTKSFMVSVTLVKIRIIIAVEQLVLFIQSDLNRIRFSTP